MTSLRLKSLTFRAGPFPESNPLEVTTSTVTLLVGPNHSGKSKCLQEISQWAQSNEPRWEVLDEIDVGFPGTVAEAEEMLSDLDPNRGEDQHGREQIRFNYYSFDRNRSQGMTIKTSQLETAIGENDEEKLTQWITRPLTVRFDAPTRFNLAKNQDHQGNPQAPANHLEALNYDSEAANRVDDVINDSLGSHFVIDPVTNPGNLQIRLSDEKPESPVVAKSHAEEGREFQREATRVDRMSDGVRAFVGLISGLESLPHQIMLLDDPEAFLHPPLARQLGEHLATVASRRNASLVAATHSSSFVQGCIESGVDVQIVRLTYDQVTGTATARTIEEEALSEMMKDPLLRSSQVLEGVFHQGAVVAEGDVDRAFYDEINRRLRNKASDESEDLGARDTVFLNAHGRGSVHRIVGGLRDLGLPAVAVFDLDVLTVDGSTWEDILTACRVPPEERDPVISESSEVASALQGVETGENRPPARKRGGLDLLEGEAHERAGGLLSDLRDWGIFIVPGGEVETWLENLGVEDKRSSWLVKIFQRMGDSPEEDGAYVRPGEGDVWEFVNQIGEWISDPDRAGMRPT